MTWRARGLALACTVCFLSAWGLLAWWLCLQVNAVLSVWFPWRPGPERDAFAYAFFVGPWLVLSYLYGYALAIMGAFYGLLWILDFVRPGWRARPLPARSDQKGVYY